jgi:Cdc6-like AAA superfamily ATPase
VDISERSRLKGILTMAFSPSAPVRSLDSFSGRDEQLHRITEAVLQPGRHAVVYGERGVGKTSLANVLPEKLERLGRFEYQVVRHNCSSTPTFRSMWEAVFREFSIKRQLAGSSPAPLLSYLPDDAGPEDVRLLLQQLGGTAVIFDEYDRVPKSLPISGLLADTIKSLSDHAVDATIILIGVADSIDELMTEHLSIERAIVQIQLPRMYEGEMLLILEKGFKQAEMEIDLDARYDIAALSHGLPHNVHELGRLAGYAALDSGRTRATQDDVETAIREAVKNAEHTVRSAYCSATLSSHQNNIYQQTLLASALSPTNDLGYFSAGGLREPLLAIAHKKYGIDGYMKHLNSFCEESRGSVLEKRGERRRYRFRFTDPVMQPFVIMKGVADHMITKAEVTEFQQKYRAATPGSLF